MASRRTNATEGQQRSRTTSQSTTTRPKSLFVADNTVPNNNSEPTSMAAPSSRPINMHKLPGLEAESNIQVFVRCRGRSAREKSEGAANIVNIDGPMAKEVVIQTAAAKTELGVTTPAATRTYPFDRVFGFAADQAMIYQEVVKPMLEEVLLGYNCTLFAYGQTGTGKTYTMQGDLTPSISGGPSAGAGMIPRVLSNLFAHLEANVADYSVKVTYVELYNEELRDLLSSSLSAPAGSEQPMSKGSGAGGASQSGNTAQNGAGNGNSSNNGKDTGPKIFEDARGGVFIQGLEEAFVRNAQEAIEQLRKGSHRRQIAATKFNDHSSRSHSVFTVTVHTKTESSSGIGGSGSGNVPGEDYLRTGKLNLVDLAGSENIGRSGAENMRAREAGNINMSLLALGRVINALVAKHSHIPYRESKLTRLLQDSLGGKTKTCIVATISPAQSNLEETFSTLDYALRAKSIRNKPEVNQKMTRNSLLKEYIGLIECLKADLLAAREKNGIYMSKESWDAMSSEQQALQQAHTDSKQLCDTLEAQLRVIREELTESLGMLMKRDGELSNTRKTLEETTEKLVTTTEKLDTAVHLHAEETVLRGAHEVTEARIDGVAQGLRNVVRESVQDVAGLWDKVDRKEGVRKNNARVVKRVVGSVDEELEGFGKGLEEFVDSQTHFSGSMRQRMESFREEELQALGNLSTHVKSSIESLNGSIRNIKANEKEASGAADQVQQLVQTTSEAIQQGFDSWASEVKKQSASWFMEVQTAVEENCKTAEKAMQTSMDTYKALVEETTAHFQREKKLVGEAKALVQDAVQSEMTRLNEQNALLRQMLESEETKTLKLQDDLLSNMASLVKGFTSSRSESLHAAGQQVQEVVSKGAEEMKAFGKLHAHTVDDALRHTDRTSHSVKERARIGYGAGEDARRAIRAVGQESSGALQGVQAEFGDKIEGQAKEVRRLKEGLAEGVSSGFSHVRQAKRARLGLTEGMSAELQESYRAMQSGIASTSHNTSQTVDYLLQQGSLQRQSTNSYKAATQTRMSTLRQATRALLEGGTREDAPTGSTPPRKRGWEYEEDWERTKSRDEVLREWTMRQQLLEQQKRDDALRERQRELREQRREQEQHRAVSEELEVETEKAEIVAPPPLSPVLAPEPMKAPPAPTAPTGAIRSSSRQSHSSLGGSQPLSYGRPSTKIGAPKRAVSVKGVPLAEKGNIGTEKGTLGTRNKRVR